MNLENALERLGKFTKPSELWAYTIRFGESLGFQSSIYACPPPHKKHTHPETLIRFHGMSTVEFQKFAIKGLVDQGHLTSANSIALGKPFQWIELANLTSNRTEFADLKREANQQGIDNGWIFPLYGPQGRVGLGSYGKPKDQSLMDVGVGQKLQIFAQTAHMRLCQITSDLFKIEKPLSKREMQIIAWAAVGKSNSEIAIILNLSDNSIDSYMRRAFAKLNVHNRTSAAVKAISKDLIRT